METFYITKGKSVELITKDAIAVINALRPLGDDFIEKSESLLASRFFDIEGLAAKEFNLAHTLIMEIGSLHPIKKEEIKEAFENDKRFKVTA